MQEVSVCRKICQLPGLGLAKLNSLGDPTYPIRVVGLGVSEMGVCFFTRPSTSVGLAIEVSLDSSCKYQALWLVEYPFTRASWRHLAVPQRQVGQGCEIDVRKDLALLRCGRVMFDGVTKKWTGQTPCWVDKAGCW